MKIVASNRIAFLVGLTLSLSAGLPALAAGTTRGPRWTEGYEWGRLNCGRYGTHRVQNKLGCMKCCSLGARNPEYVPAGELGDCQRVCLRAVWI